MIKYIPTQYKKYLGMINIPNSVGKNEVWRPRWRRIWLLLFTLLRTPYCELMLI